VQRGHLAFHYDPVGSTHNFFEQGPRGPTFVNPALAEQTFLCVVLLNTDLAHEMRCQYS